MDLKQAAQIYAEALGKLLPQDEGIVVFCYQDNKIYIVMHRGQDILVQSSPKLTKEHIGKHIVQCESEGDAITKAALEGGEFLI